MYEIRSGAVMVGDQLVDTFERDAYGEETALGVTAGTTGLCGKNSRAYVALRNLAGNFYAKLLKDKETGETLGVELAVSDEDQIPNLIRVLDFAAETLRQQILEVDD